MSADVYAFSYGWEHAEVLPEPEREPFRRRVAEIRARREGQGVTAQAPHWFISPAPGREGCDTCGGAPTGHPQP